MYIRYAGQRQQSQLVITGMLSNEVGIRSDLPRYATHHQLSASVKTNFDEGRGFVLSLMRLGATTWF